jgi:hypothetical protein
MTEILLDNLVSSEGQKCGLFFYLPSSRNVIYSFCTSESKSTNLITFLEDSRTVSFKARGTKYRVTFLNETNLVGWYYGGQ